MAIKCRKYTNPEFISACEDVKKKEKEKKHEK